MLRNYNGKAIVSNKNWLLLVLYYIPADFRLGRVQTTIGLELPVGAKLFSHTVFGFGNLNKNCGAFVMTFETFEGS